MLKQVIKLRGDEKEIKRLLDILRGTTVYRCYNKEKSKEQIIHIDTVNAFEAHLENVFGSEPWMTRNNNNFALANILKYGTYDVPHTYAATREELECLYNPSKDEAVLVVFAKSQPKDIVGLSDVFTGICEYFFVTGTCIIENVDSGRRRLMVKKDIDGEVEVSDSALLNKKFDKDIKGEYYYYQHLIASKLNGTPVKDYKGKEKDYDVDYLQILEEIKGGKKWRRK